MATPDGEDSTKFGGAAGHRSEAVVVALKIRGGKVPPDLAGELVKDAGVRIPGLGRLSFVRGPGFSGRPGVRTRSRRYRREAQENPASGSPDQGRVFVRDPGFFASSGTPDKIPPSYRGEADRCLAPRSPDPNAKIFVPSVSPPNSVAADPLNTWVQYDFMHFKLHLKRIICL